MGLYLKFHFLQIWDEAFCFSTMFFKKKQFYVLFDHIIIFHYFFELKKTRLEIPLRLVQVSGRELRYLTISSNFG